MTLVIGRPRLDARRVTGNNVAIMSGSARQDAKKDTNKGEDGRGSSGEAGWPPAALARASGALAWPGLFGWLGTIFALAGLWFVGSALVLRSAAAGMRDDDPDALTHLDGIRGAGFGDGFAGRVPGVGLRQGVRPAPPEVVRRARSAVEANALNSAVFGVYALLVAAFLWGFRLFDPAMRAMLAGTDAAEDGVVEGKGE